MEKGKGEDREAPILVSVSEAARLTGLGKTKVWELIRDGTLPSIRIGRRRLVPRQGIESLAARLDVWPETRLDGEKIDEKP